MRGVLPGEDLKARSSPSPRRLRAAKETPKLPATSLLGTPRIHRGQGLESEVPRVSVHAPVLALGSVDLQPALG
jgi:hypothetical protein